MVFRATNPKAPDSGLEASQHFIMPDTEIEPVLNSGERRGHRASEGKIK